jgi:hypothetical protein
MVENVHLKHKIMIINFPEFDNESMGGCESFRFIPVNHTQSIANAVNSVINSEPVPNSGKNILTGLAVMDTLSFSETQEESGAGTFYKTIIKGFVPKLSASYISLFSQIKQSRHIVIIKDNNGCQRVCGNIQNGMKFNFDQDTKDAPSGSNGIVFKFYGEFTEPSPFLILQ